MGTIIVGIDESEAARDALRWAIDHADDDDEIVALHAWQMYIAGGMEGMIIDPGPLKEAAEEMAHSVVAEVLSEYDDSPSVTIEIVEGHPGRNLIDRSEDADLLVIGSRGFGGFRGLLLGSVSTYCVHHVCCPVVVVPGDDGEGDDGEGDDGDDVDEEDDD
jgi:nucleotide-binding universal stress UspA family protein